MTFQPGVPVRIVCSTVKTLALSRSNSGPWRVALLAIVSLLSTSGSDVSTGGCCVSLPALITYSREIPRVPRVEANRVFSSSRNVLNLVASKVMSFYFTMSSVSSTFLVQAGSLRTKSINLSNVIRQISGIVLMVRHRLKNNLTALIRVTRFCAK